MSSATETLNNPKLNTREQTRFNARTMVSLAMLAAIA